MNSTQEIHYYLLNLLATEPQLGQRDMARKMGISLGKVNYCVTELSRKGLIKVKRFQKARARKAYMYTLTPKGIEEKGRITIQFLKRKLREYEEIKRQINDLTRDIEQSGLTATLKAELDDPQTQRT